MGKNVQVDLVGGYYDAGDNVKFGFPMAFTTTMLSWSVIEFGGLMKGELGNAKEAIRWASDYLLKATARPDTIYVQVCPAFSSFLLHSPFFSLGGDTRVKEVECALMEERVKKKCISCCYYASASSAFNKFFFFPDGEDPKWKQIRGADGFWVFRPRFCSC